MPSRRFWTGRAGRIAALAGMALVMAPVAAPARMRDTDRDRMPDRWERANGLRVKSQGRAPGRSTATRCRTSASTARARSPRSPDSDHDCIADAREDAGPRPGSTTATS